MRRHLFLYMMILATVNLAGDLHIRTVDFLKTQGLQINAAGPVLIRADTSHRRLIVANTLTSSISLINAADFSVTNVPIGGRALQHLKAEALDIHPQSGAIALVGDHAFHLVDPVKQTCQNVTTEKQFESICWDAVSGNVYLAGGESGPLLMYTHKTGKTRALPWQLPQNKSGNLNQTPPPPLRKVIADNKAGQIIAIDGYTASLTLFRARDGARIRQFALPLHPGGRWHLAGFNEETQILYLVIETAERKVTQAGRIDITSSLCQVINLPKLTEGAGITYNPLRDEVYIPYDNHPTVHVVRFADSTVAEIKVPNFGNDATALDAKHNRLYVASWAQGEIDVIDLEKQALIQRIRNLGILPHMFNMAFEPGHGYLYIPRGATAVNGSFGAAVMVLDPHHGHYGKIYTGWAPIELCHWPGDGKITVFNNEDQYAMVQDDGTFALAQLPGDYPLCAQADTGGDLFLSYGPHQSYWPVVYIWGARNGIFNLDKTGKVYNDRRIPRQAQQMALDENGSLFFTQNAWGKEEQFIGVLDDPVRDFSIDQRILLGDTIERETTARMVQHDRAAKRLYSIKTGETESEPGLLHIIDPASRQVTGRIQLGLNPSDLCYDNQNIYVANFSSRQVTVIDKTSLTTTNLHTDAQPLRFRRYNDRLYLLCHSGHSLFQIKGTNIEKLADLPSLPCQLLAWRNQLVIATFDKETLYLYRFDPQSRILRLMHLFSYPYGDTRFDSGNVSFYLQGQYGDAVFDLIKGFEDEKGRLWMSDFLAGKVYLFDES